ncbi:hypothetical protein DSECCO2_503700 [anaerobic digester metagenome]
MRTFLSVMMLVISVIVATGQTIPFAESFENGVTKWNNLSSGGTVEASTTGAFVGTKSLHITGTGAGAGLSLDFAVSQEPSVIFYYVKVSGGEGGVVAVGNGHSTNNAAFYGEVTGGNFVVTGSTGTTNLGPVTSNEWVRVEVRNLNFIAMTYDIYLNGVLKGKGLPFRGSVPGISTVDVYNQTAGAEAWWDAFYVGLSDFEYPVFDGTKICANEVDDITVSPAVALDSAGVFTDNTLFSIGPFASDDMVEYGFPFLETSETTDNGNSLEFSGNMFDLTAAKDLVVYGFDINPRLRDNVQQVKVFYRADTYVGHGTSNAGWILVDSLDFYAQPAGKLSHIELTQPITIPEGATYGIYVCISTGPNYTTATGSNGSFSNDDIQFEGGYGGMYFNSTSARIWSGRIYYKVAEEHKEFKSMTSLFARNNQYNGNMFDLQVKNDFVIDSIDVNIVADGWVKLYMRQGTCVGNNTSNAGWNLIDSVQVVAAGSDMPTRVPLSNKVLLRAGNLYGVYVCSFGSMEYTNIIAGTNDVYTDSNMVLTGYYGGTNTFSCSSSRIWNGTIYYSLRNVDEIVPQAQTNSNTGMARGYVFQSTKDFRIIGAMVPTDVPGNQTVSIIRLDTLPPVYSNVTNNLVNLGYRTGIPNGQMIPFDVFVAKGDWIGVYAEGDYSSYSEFDTLFVVLGDTIARIRSGMQFDLTTSQMHDVWLEPSSGNISRVQLYVEPVTLHGGIDSVLIDVQTPAPDLGADGDYCVQNIVTLDPGTFSSYDWSTAESTPTIDVDTTGVPLNAPFDIWVTVTDQYGCTGSDTITISFIDCTGIDENDITVSVYPNPSDDVFYLKADNVQDEMLVQVFGLDGRLVKEVVLNETFGSIDMSNELPGVYSIRITIKDQVKEMRVVLQ